jgi:hypothetical protein
MSSNARVALVIYSVCFAIGCSTHALDIVRGGWLPYRFAPIGINIFWSLLAVLDPLTVVLIVRRRKWGLALAASIMVLDVAVNSYAVYALDVPLHFWPLQLQTLFCGFVLGSLPFLWPPSMGNRSDKVLVSHV